MITNLFIQNFKSIRKADLAFSNLNLLFGLNGMGKSSLIQTLLLLRQSDDNYIRLSSDLVSLGKGRDVYFQFAEENEHIISICPTFEGKGTLTIELKYESEYTSLDNIAEKGFLQSFNEQKSILKQIKRIFNI